VTDAAPPPLSCGRWRSGHRRHDAACRRVGCRCGYDACAPLHDARHRGLVGSSPDSADHLGGDSVDDARSDGLDDSGCDCTGHDGPDARGDLVGDGSGDGSGADVDVASGVRVGRGASYGECARLGISACCWMVDPVGRPYCLGGPPLQLARVVIDRFDGLIVYELVTRDARLDVACTYGGPGVSAGRFLDYARCGDATDVRGPLLEEAVGARE
jgi:hypothetical protein